MSHVTHIHQGYSFFIYTQIMYIHTVLYVEVKLYVIALCNGSPA